jgi:MYXO-CTERM domain-containing protein
MPKHSRVMGRVLPVLVASAVMSVASFAAADSDCAGGRCSIARAALKLEGKDPLRTSIDTGWMPSCGDGREHCNKGLQIRANIALTAVTSGDNLFTASLAQSAAVKASWENPGKLELRLASLPGQDGVFTVTHALTPQVEVYVDIGPIEQGWTIPATRLLQLIPGSRFAYSATASAPFNGWALDGASVTVPAPALQDAQLFSIEMNNVIGKVANGTISLHAQTSPTVTYRTKKVMLADRELRTDSVVQIPFPPGNHDYLEFPASIEGELTATGDIDVLPAATLSNLGDVVFNPAVTITFSSVKVTKHYESAPQKYSFADKTIRIPLPNVRHFVLDTDAGDVKIGTDGTVPAVMENTGEAPLQVRLESSDPRFVVPDGPVLIGPKSRQALNVIFRPEELGPAEATITARTNDPDTPELTFTVKANGAERTARPGSPGSGEDGEDGPEAGADGCGCKATGAPAGHRWAGLGAIALGLVALARRRRS